MSSNRARTAPGTDAGRSDAAARPASPRPGHAPAGPGHARPALGHARQSPGHAPTGDYRAPRWLPGGHAQTIWPTRLARARIAPGGVAYRRHTLEAPDGDFVDVDETGPCGADLCVVLWHGLEGSSSSPYALALMHACAARGWRACVVHWRGCSGRPNRLARAYHSGDTAEFDWLMPLLRPRYVAGVSLGGNALLKWLGQQGRAGSRPDGLRAAAAVSAPHDLRAGAHRLARGFNRAVYARHFMHTLVPKSLEKLDRFPGLYDARAVAAARDFIAFDELVTAPLHGFAGAEDYWRRSSCGPWLAHVRVPTLVLNALNDPFIPATSLTGRAQVSGAVRLEYPGEGGHAGFVHGAFPGRIDWLAHRLIRFFESNDPERAEHG